MLTWIAVGLRLPIQRASVMCVATSSLGEPVAKPTAFVHGCFAWPTQTQFDFRLTFVSHPVLFSFVRGFVSVVSRFSWPHRWEASPIPVRSNTIHFTTLHDAVWSLHDTLRCCFHTHTCHGRACFFFLGPLPARRIHSFLILVFLNGGP